MIPIYYRMNKLRKNLNITYKFINNGPYIENKTVPEIKASKCECLYCHIIVSYSSMIGHQHACKMNPRSNAYKPDSFHCECGSVLTWASWSNDKHRIKHLESKKHFTNLQIKK